MKPGFVPLLRSEWTKFRTVRAWVVGAAAAAVVTVLMSLLGAAGSSSPGGGPPVGPDGVSVNDTFSFAGRQLDGEGSLTVRVTSLTGQVHELGPEIPASDGVHPWAKAGLMIRAGRGAGSRYAAIMVTPDHGVRLQHDYLNDVAGPDRTVSPDEPLWLRLTRTGDVVTGAESSDGASWRDVGAVRLPDLPAAVVAGMFVTSPELSRFEQEIGGINSMSTTSEAIGVFDQVTTDGQWTAGPWEAGGAGDEIDGRRKGGVGSGRPPIGPRPEGPQPFEESAGTFTLRGSGDVGPATAWPGTGSIEQGLIGTFAGLVVVIVVAASFLGGEHRRGLLRTTFAATPARGQVLVAKAVVIGTTTFGVGMVAAGLSVLAVTKLGGRALLVVDTATTVRVIVGTAGLIGVSAVLTLAVTAIVRRSAGAVAAVVAALVLPYILTMASVLPSGAAAWLLRITPAAGFAIQQSMPEYAQVDGFYVPATGYFPLSPGAGFAVLVGWTAATLVLAGALLRRRDA